MKAKLTNCFFLRIVLLALAFVLIVSLVVVAAPKPKAEAEPFVAPHAISATSISSPTAGQASGLAKFLITVGATGNLDSLQTIDGPSSLVGSAMDAMLGWKFAGATLNGSATTSSIPVDVLFNPGSSSAAHASPISVGAHLEYQTRPDYVPPKLESASYATYPPRSVAGSVVLNIRLDTSGHVEEASAVFTTPSLTTAPAISAVKHWTFSPGELHGAPVPANVVIAFVLGSSPSGNTHSSTPKS